MRAPEFLLDTLVVKFKVWDEARVSEIVREVGGTLSGTIPVIRWAEVKVPVGQTSDLFCAYAAHDEIADVSISGVVRQRSLTTAFATSLPADHMFAAQMRLGHLRMFVARAWKYTKGAGRKICVADSGTVPGSGEFAGKAVQTWNSQYDATEVTLLDDFGDPYPVDVANRILGWGGHGQYVATVACANADGSGVVGIAPEADLVGVCILEAREVNPTYNGASSDLAATRGLIEGHEVFGAEVLNLSSGDYSNLDPAAWLASRPIWSECLERLRVGGAVVLAAGGNEREEPGSPTQSYYLHPGGACMYAGHLGVAAFSTMDTDRIAYYSGRGPTLNVAAPSHPHFAEGNVGYQSFPYPAALPPEGWETQDRMYVSSGGRMAPRADMGFNGTSAAAPEAAGVLILILSANPELNGQQAKDIMLATGDAISDPESAALCPNAIIPNAYRGVLKAISLRAENAGSVFPCLNFYGPGAKTDYDPVTRTATMHLYGTVLAEVDGFSTDPITQVELWADADLIYRGPPTNTRLGNLVPVAAARLADKTLKVVAFTSATSAEESYSDMAAHDVNSSAAPRTTASPPSGSVSGPITITVESDHRPVRISYRWGSGPWQTYTGPIPAQTDTLQFYGVDALGNIEGGVDYAAG